MTKQHSILIVDDEQGVCDLLTRLFEREGYVVEHTTDSLKAADLVKSLKPNCLLLDVIMPKIAGVEVLASVRLVHPEIKVIMITGHGNLETAMESMKLGAYDYVTKPFDLAFIKELVARAVKE
jgi:two-component system, NtrC family, response regulator AtoC